MKKVLSFFVILTSFLLSCDKNSHIKVINSINQNCYYIDSLFTEGTWEELKFLEKADSIIIISVDKINFQNDKRNQTFINADFFKNGIILTHTTFFVEEYYSYFSLRCKNKEKEYSLPVCEGLNKDLKKILLEI